MGRSGEAALRYPVTPVSTSPSLLFLPAAPAPDFRPLGAYAKLTPLSRRYCKFSQLPDISRIGVNSLECPDKSGSPLWLPKNSQSDGQVAALQETQVQTNA